MRVIRSEQREEDGRITIGLQFKAREQLIDPGDPSPADRQELTEEAESSIIGNFDAVPLRTPVILEIRLPDSPVPMAPVSVPEIIHNHFRYLLSLHERESRIFRRERRWSIAFTVINFMIAIVFGALYLGNESRSTSLAWLLVGFIIIVLTWTTVWNTYESFIYEGLRKRHRMKLLEKIIGADIRVVPVQ